MKKAISLLTAFAILLTSVILFNIVANASYEKKQYKNYIYCYDENGELNICKYIGNEKDIVVPQQIDSHSKNH